MMFPIFLGQRVPPETLANTLAELDRCLQLLEDKFLKDQDFLAGPPHLSGGLGGHHRADACECCGAGGLLSSGVPQEGACAPAHIALSGWG